MAIDILVGSKFKRTYPFMIVSAFQVINGVEGVDDFWIAGCDRHVDWDDHGLEIVDYSANGIGYIEYEVLAVADMPRSYQKRIIYKITLTDPDGREKSINKAFIATESKFMKWIEKDDAYHSDYAVR